MSQEPKKRHSRQRQGKRRAALHLDVPSVVTCQNCGNKHLPHMVCPSCGYYKGQQYIAVKQDTKPKHENA